MSLLESYSRGLPVFWSMPRVQLTVVYGLGPMIAPRGELPGALGRSPRGQTGQRLPRSPPSKNPSWGSPGHGEDCGVFWSYHANVHENGGRGRRLHTGSSAGLAP